MKITHVSEGKGYNIYVNGELAAVVAQHSSGGWYYYNLHKNLPVFNSLTTEEPVLDTKEDAIKVCKACIKEMYEERKPSS